MTEVEVSVLVCTRDRPDQLIRCLKSLLDLDFHSFEIIVVDNGSKNFSIPDLSFSRPTRFFSQPVPGLSYARNLAVRQARGEFVAFLDDDAVVAPGWLKFSIRRFEDPLVHCVTGRVIPLQLETKWQRKILQSGWFPDSEDPQQFDQTNFNAITTTAGNGCNFLVRKSFFANHEFSKIFGAGTPVGGKEDHYLFYEVIRSGFRIFYEPTAVVYHEYPATEVQYRKKVLQYCTAHGAYLIKFLFSEKGYRLWTLKYLARKIIFLGKNGPGVPAGFRVLGMLLGPLALLRSTVLARKNRDLALRDASLLASSGDP